MKYLRSTLIENTDKGEFQRAVKTVCESWPHLEADPETVHIDVQYGGRSPGGYNALVTAWKAAG